VRNHCAFLFEGDEMKAEENKVEEVKTEEIKVEEKQSDIFEDVKPSEFLPTVFKVNVSSLKYAGKYHARNSEIEIEESDIEDFLKRGFIVLCN
jgi:hypothetical protein